MDPLGKNPVMAAESGIISYITGALLLPSRGNSFDIAVLHPKACLDDPALSVRL